TSIVHVLREPGRAVQAHLDGQPAETISAFLFHQGTDQDPMPLAENAARSFQGSIVLGMGFTFDDTNPHATPVCEMQELIAKSAHNADRIFPFLGGEELNASPTQTASRYVIDFGEMTEPEARRWPDLFAILEAKVKPDRAQKDARKYPRMVHEW